MRVRVSSNKSPMLKLFSHKRWTGRRRSGKNRHTEREGREDEESAGMRENVRKGKEGKEATGSNR